MLINLKENVYPGLRQHILKKSVRGASVNDIRFTFGNILLQGKHSIQIAIKFFDYTIAYLKYQLSHVLCITLVLTLAPYAQIV